MRKRPTGELCAGKPHAQFGGRGGRESFPTPINKALHRNFVTLRFTKSRELGRYVFLEPLLK